MGKFLHHPSKDAASALNVNLTSQTNASRKQQPPSPPAVFPLPFLLEHSQPWPYPGDTRRWGLAGGRVQGPSQGTCKPRGSATSAWAWGCKPGSLPCCSLQLPPRLLRSGPPGAELVGSPLLPPCPYTQRCTPAPRSGPQSTQETAAAALPPLRRAGAVRPRWECPLAPPCRALHRIPSGL